MTHSKRQPAQSNQPPVPFRLKVLVATSAIILFGGLAWFLYQRALFFHREEADSHTNQLLEQPRIESEKDSLEHNGYLILKTEKVVDSVFRIYSVLVKRNGRVVFHTPDGVFRKEFNEIALPSLLGDDSKQLVIQQFSGGAHCCWKSWVIDLRDTISILHRSEDYPELGYELGFEDIDGDGTTELDQPVIAFDYFDRLSHPVSPFSVAYFKYSAEKKKYVLANRTFAKDILRDIRGIEQTVRSFSDTTTPSTNSDSSGEYLTLVLRVVIDYVYAGQKEIGWAFFDQWYALPDKAKMRKKIQDVFEASRIYRELYAR